MKALVLAGGHGTRLRPLTYTSAKQLIQIANKPVLFYALEDLSGAGIKDAIINVAPHSKEDVMKAVGDGSRFGLKVTYNEQEAPLGIAHAVKITRHLLGDEPFVVYLGDNILKGGIANYVSEFVNSDADAITLLSRVKNPERFGVVEIEGDRVVKLIEKPKVPSSDLAMVGVYFLRAAVFESIERLQPSWRNELEIAEAYQDMVDRGKKVRAIVIEGWWGDTGRPEDVFEANQMILDDLKPFNYGKCEENVILQGRLGIGNGTTIRKNTVVRGPAIIGENCEIGPDAYIGPYTSIGSGAIVRNCEIENSIIMDGSKIVCDKRIIDSLIGKESVIERENRAPKGIKAYLGERTYLRV